MKLLARVGAALLWVAGIGLPVSTFLSPNVAMAQDDGSSDDSSSDDSSGGGDESSGETSATSTESSTEEDSSTTRNWREADQGEGGGD
jgi:basic membrane lipoprotein Med (substrate-binding protein (PBP1-ABC) superfamily)